MAAEERQMMDSAERPVDPKPATPPPLLEQAVDNLSLALVIFDSNAKVVFCNKRYMAMYRLSAEQVKPGTPVSELIQHRLNLGFKVLSRPDQHNWRHAGNAVIPGTTVQHFTDGRIISFTVYPLPDGGGMATHEDITAREEINARL